MAGRCKHVGGVYYVHAVKYMHNYGTILLLVAIAGAPGFRFPLLERFSSPLLELHTGKCG